MTDPRDDFLSVLGEVFTSPAGRVFLLILVALLGVAAGHATALHEFVWPWEVAGEAVQGFYLSFLLIFFFPAGTLAFAAMIGFLYLFLWKEIHWGFLLIPFLVAWLASTWFLYLTHYR
jgi:hypothetical protein